MFETKIQLDVPFDDFSYVDMCMQTADNIAKEGNCRPNARLPGRRVSVCKFRTARSLVAQQISMSSMRALYELGQLTINPLHPKLEIGAHP